MSTQEMSFWDHLEELRWTLFRVVIALFVFAIGGFIIMPWFFDNIIMAPAKAGFFLYKWMCRISQSIPFLPDFCDDNFKIDMVNIDLTAPFFRHLSTSFWIALILICPYILFEVWRFISPALYEHEKKNVRWVFLFGSVMFFIGCLVGYGLIFPMTLRFLYNYTLSPIIHNTVSLDSYMDNFLILVFIMGFVFEMPLISWLLSQIGILRKSFFKTYRRHAILILLILAAIITPTGDPFTLSLVFIPLYALYELSILLVKDDPKEEEEEVMRSST
ncbi:Sec-independent protein translocase protein TatC [Bacteroidia bacterium]|nr:Sec-independent protein translocase protein TatC [Bacteroidia bacterium]GHU79285.1 Sec-independent protein translocase protein TatC [Bacteroidia bacterium]